MVLAVLLQHYRNLIFKSLNSTQFFRNEFVSTHLNIADSILLFFRDVQLLFKSYRRYLIFKIGSFQLFLFVGQKLIQLGSLVRLQLAPNRLFLQLGNVQFVVFKDLFCLLQYSRLIFSTFLLQVFLVILTFFFPSQNTSRFFNKILLLITVQIWTRNDGKFVFYNLIRFLWR